MQFINMFSNSAYAAIVSLINFKIFKDNLNAIDCKTTYYIIF